MKNIHNSALLFSISFITSLTITYFLNPSFLEHSEFWAEEGHFYSDALNYSFFNNILLKDWGIYYSILPRTIAWLVGFFSVSIINVPFIFHLISGIFIAICTSIFCFKTFSCIIKSNFLRFLICILFNLNFDFELRYINNISYYGAIPIILFIVYSEYSKKELSKTISIISGLFIFILCLSKPIFMSLVPVFLFMIYREIKNKKILSSRIIVSTFSISGSLLQVLSYLFLNTFSEVKAKENILNLPLFDLFNETIFNFLSIPIGNSFGIIYFKLLPLNIITLLISFILFCLIFIIIRVFYNEKTIFNLFIYFCISSLINSFLISASGFGPPLNFTQLDFLSSRRFFVSSVFFVLIFYIFIFNFFSNILHISKIKYITIFIFLTHINSNNVFRIQSFNIVKFPVVGAAHWKEDYKLFNHSNYCIPINPFGWLIKKNCDSINNQNLNIYNFVNTKEFKNIKFFKKTLSLNNDIYNKKIQTILILAPNVIVNEIPILKIYYGNNNTINVKPKTRNLFQGFYRFTFLPELSYVKKITIINNALIPLSNNVPIVFFYGWDNFVNEGNE